MRTVIMSIASLRIQTHLFTYKKKKNNDMVRHGVELMSL
jgi:hypothetical protein